MAGQIKLTNTTQSSPPMGDDKPKDSKEIVDIVAGDDPIKNFGQDFLGFREPAISLTKQLHNIAMSSGVCCAIVGSWGTGKSSFLGLMKEYVEKESKWINASCIWYTAWDSKGIKGLSEAMLYRFFSDFCARNPDAKLEKEKNSLEEALGLRRSLKGGITSILRAVGDVEGLPEIIKGAAKMGAETIVQLDTQKEVRESFDALFDYLEKKQMFVFFFFLSTNLTEQTGIK